MKIAILGAGFSGCHIYSLLKKDGHDVTIFEKSRGVGGRCSTKYIDDKLIDHGTPFFQTQERTFNVFCEEKEKQNILIKNGDCYYPKHGMNKLCSSLINDLDLIKNTKINAVNKRDSMWILTDENAQKYGNFDNLIITIPAPQVLQMEINLDSAIYKKLNQVKYDSIATLIVYSYTLQNLMNAKLLIDTSFKKIVDNSSKYTYQTFSSYVIHLNENISNENNFISKQDIEKFICEKVFDTSGINLKDDFHTIPHLWKYALVSKSLNQDYIYDSSLGLGICGDYFNGNNLNGAYLSSKRLYENKFR